MQELELIDAHIHLWDPYTTPRTVTPALKLFGRFPRVVAWLMELVTPQPTLDFVGETDHIMAPYLPALYLSETGKYKVRGVVHIQADWQSKKPLDMAGETRWLDQLDPKPLAMVGEARVNDVQNLDALLDAHQAASSRFRGIRDMLAAHPSKKIHQWNKSLDMMKSEAFRQGYARLGERELSFDAFIYSNQLPDLCDLVEAIPSTPIVVDHVATPIGLMGPFGGVGTSAAERAKIKEKWYAGLTRLAQSKHVMIKLSGLFMPIVGWDHDRWSKPIPVNRVVEAIGAHIQFAIDTFGVDRCMFATNFPPDRVLMSFESYYDAYFKIVEGLSMEAKRKLFHDNAARFYRIE